MNKKILILIIVLIAITGVSLKVMKKVPVNEQCQDYDIEQCPQGCVVCPPCIECSSISCQTETFCKNIGFGKGWYEGIKRQIDSFEDCVKGGNNIMESYPMQCRTKDGETFVEYIGNELEKTDLIRIDNPRPNQEIESPIIIEGEARGYWFFEGDFPVVLTDWDGKIIAEGFVTAQSEWMVEDFVRYKGSLEFEKPNYSNRGSLILQKDNPSDLPENDDTLEIPIKFK